MHTRDGSLRSGARGQARWVPSAPDLGVEDRHVIYTKRYLPTAPQANQSSPGVGHLLVFVVLDLVTVINSENYVTIKDNIVLVFTTVGSLPLNCLNETVYRCISPSAGLSSHWLQTRTDRAARSQEEEEEEGVKDNGRETAECKAQQNRKDKQE